MDNIEFPRGNEQETLLTISNLAARAGNWKEKLDKIIQFTRPHFIFDNIVIYFTEIETNRIDVLYARATGRGKSQGADISWGESNANKVISEKRMILDVPQSLNVNDRLQMPYTLGLPLSLYDNMTGALVFVRFGGPEYTPESIDNVSNCGVKSN